MRLRNVQGSQDIIKASPYCVENPGQYQGCWNTYFKRAAPLHVEIGMGKGRFIREMALLHPEINYLGVELFSSVLIRAVQKVADEDIPNLRFLWLNAESLPEVFGPGEVDRIYLNFSDPWPKARHAKRRLTSVPFLDRYRLFLAANGQLEFKTDNEALFRFSLESVPEAGWRLTACTFDLHRDEIMNEGNVLTEYEEKFSDRGQPIFKLIAAPPQAKDSAILSDPGVIE